MLIPTNSAIELIGKQYYVEKTAVPVYEGEDEEFEYIVYTNNKKRMALFSFNEGDMTVKQKIKSQKNCLKGNLGVKYLGNRATGLCNFREFFKIFPAHTRDFSL